MDRATSSPPGRRRFIMAAGAALLSPMGARRPPPQGESRMYGLIGKITVVPGKRDELIGVLIDGVAGMPGCLSYVVARDRTDADAIWVTEVWESQQSHEASLSLDSVKQAIAGGRPLIAGFSARFETEPVGGHGLTRAAAG